MQELWALIASALIAVVPAPVVIEPELSFSYADVEQAVSEQIEQEQNIVTDVDCGNGEIILPPHSSKMQKCEIINQETGTAFQVEVDLVTSKSNVSIQGKIMPSDDQEVF
jgi:hypothetical protein